MILKIEGLRLGLVTGLAGLVLLVAGCASEDDPGSMASGPGVENPASAPLGSIQPGIGGAGNGGGVSGGGSGMGGAGQGAR